MAWRSIRVRLSSCQRAACRHEADQASRHRRIRAAARLPERNAIQSRKFPQGADYCRLCELLDRMRCVPLAQKKYSTMNFIARSPTRLAVLLFALVFSALSARADELQDIDRLLKQGQHAQALERVNQYLSQKPK